MPNWCDNYISINANEELQEKIAEFVRSEESDFDFEKVIPMPENIYRGTLGSKEEKVYGKNNWRDWRLEHWGTEWNASVENAEPFEYWIKTAWTPCEPVIAELARLFPEAKSYIAMRILRAEIFADKTSTMPENWFTGCGRIASMIGPLSFLKRLMKMNGPS